MKHVLQNIVSASAKATTLDALGDGLVAILSDHIPFDRVNIGLIDLKRYEFNDVYVFGLNVDGRERGHLRTLNNTVVEKSIRSGEGYFFGTSDTEVWLKRFSNFGPVLKSGIRSMLTVPIASNDEIIAALVLAARYPKAYTTNSLELVATAAEIITPQIKNLRRNMQNK